MQEDDTIDILGLTTFTPGKNLSIQLTHKDGKKDSFEVAHMIHLTKQIEWFKAGGALNIIQEAGCGMSANMTI